MDGGVCSRPLFLGAGQGCPARLFAKYRVARFVRNQQPGVIKQGFRSPFLQRNFRMALYCAKSLLARTNRASFDALYVLSQPIGLKPLAALQ